MGQTLADGAVMLFVAPRSEWTLIEGSWGDLLGLKGSGSHSIRFDGGRIPAHFALENTTMISVDVSGGSPGYALHGNPMYASRALAFFSIEMGAIVVGMAQGALEEYEQLIRTRRTQRPPIIPRAEHPDYQTWFGTAVGRIAAAEALQLKVCEQWMEVCRRNVEEGPPFTAKDDLLMNMQAREVLRIVWDTMQEILMKTAGSSALREGERLERIYRDLSMAWGHFHNILGTWTAREYTREHLGLAGSDGALTMRAAILEEFGRPLVVEEVDLLPPAPDGVIVRTGASAFCITDCTNQRGDLGKKLPTVLGHAGMGVVEEVGPLVTRTKVGDRVIVPGTPECRQCYWCVHGRPDQCAHLVVGQPQIATRASGEPLTSSGGGGDVRGADARARELGLPGRDRPAGRAARRCSAAA